MKEIRSKRGRVAWRIAMIILAVVFAYLWFGVWFPLESDAATWDLQVTS